MVELTPKPFRNRIGLCVVLNSVSLSAAIGISPAQSPSRRATSTDTATDQLVAEPLPNALVLIVTDSELERGSSGQETSVDSVELAPNIRGTSSRVISIS